MQAQSFSRQADCHSSFTTGTSDTNSSWFPRKLTAYATNNWEAWSCKTVLEKINFTPNTYITESQTSLAIASRNIRAKYRSQSLDKMQTTARGLDLCWKQQYSKRIVPQKSSF